MEHPSNLEENLEKLLTEMRILKQLKSEVEKKGGWKMKSWLQNVEVKERELDEIKKELEQLRTPGFHPNKFNVRVKLNKKVIEILGAVESLNRRENLEGSRENGNEVEALISEMEKWKPQRYTYDQLMNIITLNVKVGRGGFGDVYRGKIDKVEVAVKVLRENVEKVIEKKFITEMRIMFQTSHQNLVKLLRYCFHPSLKALVYEYMVNGSLDSILYKKEVTLQWETLYNIAIETSRALSHLHESYSEPIIHYDIKAINVLVDSNFSAKVTDFGMSKIYKKELSHFTQTSIGGTCGYAAPEVSLRVQAMTLNCDVFSFGMMLFEILRRKRISNDEDWYPLKVWEAFNDGRLDKMILDSWIEKKYLEKAERLSIVGLWCTQFVPNNRPMMSDVVKVLEGGMQFPLPPPNPDTIGLFSSNRRDERSDDADEEVEDESWNTKKYSYTLNLDIPAYQPKTNNMKPEFAKSTAKSIQVEVAEGSRIYSSSTSTVHNEQTEMKEVQGVDEEKESWISKMHSYSKNLKIPVYKSNTNTTKVEFGTTQEFKRPEHTVSRFY